jgi:hypothetical protein
MLLVLSKARKFRTLLFGDEGLSHVRSWMRGNAVFSGKRFDLYRNSMGYLRCESAKRFEWC